MDLRRKKKKVLKERKSLQEKMRLKMIIPGDTGPGLLENSLFGLNQIKTAEVHQHLNGKIIAITNK